jgi:F-type H+-transporting ATPase subunit alpha
VGRYEAALYKFIGDRYPQIFSTLKEKKEISPDLDKLMTEALNAFDEEFKETVK